MRYYQTAQKKDFPDVKNIATADTQILDTAILELLPSKNSRQRLSLNSKKAYARAVRDFNRFITERGLELNEHSLLAYFDSISHLSPATLNQRKYALLKVIKAQFGDTAFKSMAVEQVFGRIPAYQIDHRISDDETLHEEQVLALMGAATDKTRLIIQFLFQTACRVSEMIGIRLKDCYVMADKVKIRVSGKGRKIREVFIKRSLHDEIREVYRGGNWLFESQSGNPLDRKNVWTQINQTGRKIGLSNVHPHMLRHTRATDMIVNKNVSVKAASQYLGHATSAITLDMYVKDRVDIDDLLGRDMI